MKTPFQKSLQRLLGTMVVTVAMLALPAHAEPVAEQPTSVERQKDMMKVIRDRGYLVVGNSFKFPTLNAKNPDTGEFEGFFVDISKALAKSIFGDENKLRFVYAGGVDNLGAVQFVIEGNVDVVIDAVAQSDAKRKVSFITDSILDSGSALMVRKDSPIRSFEDFNENTTVLFGIFSNDRELLRAVKPEATYVPYLENLDMATDFANGKGDAIVEFFPFLLVNAAKIPNVKIVGQFTDKPYGMVSPKADAAFGEYLNQFLRKMKASGEYQRIFDKWFGKYLGQPDLNKPVHAAVMKRVLDAEVATRAERPPYWVSLSLLLVSTSAEREKAAKYAGTSTSPTMAAIRKRGKVIVGTTQKLRQTNFPNPQTKQNEGFMPDLANAVAKQLPGGAVPVEWRHFASEQAALDAVRSGAIDLIMGGVGLGYNFENTQLAEFTVEINRSGPALLVKKGSPIAAIGDIRSNMRVLYPKSMAREVRRIKERSPRATLIEVSNSAEGLAALKAGKGDVYADMIPELYDLAVQNTDYTLVGRYAERPDIIICRKGDLAMRSHLISIVSRMVESGEREKLNEKWFIPYGGAVVR